MAGFGYWSGRDVHVDPDVRLAYPGEGGLTLGFSAPVLQDGKAIAYVSHRTRFAVVEEVVTSTYAELQADESFWLRV